MFVLVNGNVFSSLYVIFPNIGHVKNKKLVTLSSSQSLLEKSHCFVYFLFHHSRRHMMSDCPAIGDVKFVCLAEV